MFSDIARYHQVCRHSEELAELVPYAVIEAAAVHWDRLGTLELLGLLEKEAVVARPQSIQAWNRASPSPERQSWRQRRIRQKLHLSLKEEGFQSQRESSLHADAVAADGSSLVT